jgi:outer membrane receptor protein involved in Fe transport
MLDPSVENFVERTIFALGYRMEDELFSIKNNPLRINLGCRFDNSIDGLPRFPRIFSQHIYGMTTETIFSGSAGIIYAMSSIPILFRSNYSYNFRFPNFNEMYYRNYGTKNLLPETSDNINVGVSYDF